MARRLLRKKEPARLSTWPVEACFQKRKACPGVKRARLFVKCIFFALAR